MKEIGNQISEAVKDRLSNSLFRTFILSWIVFHWEFLFVILFVSEESIFNYNSLLKNDYLVIKFFNFKDPWFYFDWIMPFILTYLIIWVLPKTIFISADEQDVKYEEEKIKLQINLEAQRVKLQQQNSKKIEEETKQIIEKRKIKNIDPTIGWSDDYFKFKRLAFVEKFQIVMEAYYKHEGNIKEYAQFGDVITFEVPEDILAYLHSNDVIEIVNNKIIFTEKGKYFVDKYLSDKNKVINNEF